MNSQEADGSFSLAKNSIKLKRKVVRELAPSTVSLIRADTFSSGKSLGNGILFLPESRR